MQNYDSKEVELNQAPVETVPTGSTKSKALEAMIREKMYELIYTKKGKVLLAATAIGALAAGMVAYGFVAIGKMAVGDAHFDNLSVKKMKINHLKVKYLEVEEQI